MFSESEIGLLLDELAYETLCTTVTEDQPLIRVQRKMTSGYSKDPNVAALQAKLSVMLQSASGR